MVRTSLLPIFALAAAFAQAPTGDGPLLLTLEGKGWQVYRCDAAAWVLDHPDADLLDSSGNVVGHHDKGPSWHYKDGSRVVGEPIEKTPSKEPGAVPWLRLRTVAHDGAGIMTTVETIRRTETHGGVAPTGGCDAAHAGAVTQVPYTAKYSFYGKP